MLHLLVLSIILSDCIVKFHFSVTSKFKKPWCREYLMFVLGQVTKSKAALEVPWNHIETGKQTRVTQVQTSNPFWACKEGPHSPYAALACFHQLILTCVILSLPLCAPCIHPLGMEQDTRSDLERSSDRKPPVKKPRLPPKRNMSLDFPGTVLFCVCMCCSEASSSFIG